MALTEEGIMHVPGMHSRWVRLAGGAKAHYMTAGESGPPVILIHGGLIGLSGAVPYRFTGPFLGANGFRVYCPDLPGFGLSDVADEHRPTGLESHQDFLHQFANALCLERFHLGGYSLGCFHTALYVVSHPDRVISFVLIAGLVGDLVPLAEQERVAPTPRIPPFDGSRESMRTIIETVTSRPETITDDLIEMETAMAIRTRPAYRQWEEAAWRTVLPDTDDPSIGLRFRTRDRLDKITIPGIYLWGRLDARNPFIRASYQEDALPNLQFFYTEDAGHEAQSDKPKLYNRIFLEFFRDGKVSWEAAQRAGISRRRPPNPNLVGVPATAR